MIVLLPLFVVAGILVLEAFFSGSEIAFVSANRAKLWRKAKDGDPKAAEVKLLLGKPETLFSTTVVGTTLCMTAATTITTLFVLHYYGEPKEWINMAILTPVILIFAEFVPKMIARQHADTLVLRLARPLTFMSLLLAPFTKLLSLYAQILKRILSESPERSFFLSREEIKAALPASHGSDVTSSERELIEAILEFGHTSAGEMLRPLIDVVGIEENETIREAIKLFTESSHSRIPVYQERIDRIVGVLHAYDCLKATNLDQPLKNLMQPAFFVPESKPLDELFMDLKTKSMAIVVNEYGGAEGIVTMEDVMEEVVGEIEDEYDEPPKLFRKIGENSFIVNARMEVHELRDALKIPVPEDEDYSTLAGFLLKRMEKIPKKWDSAIIDGVEYVVQSATDRSIEEVYIIVHSPPTGGP